MLQYLSTETYNSSVMLIPFSLTPREKDKEYPLYLESRFYDRLWKIRATGSSLTCESTYKSFTVTYDLAITYLRMGRFALRVILEDGSYDFVGFPSPYDFTSGVEFYTYLIEEENDLIDETLSVYAELINDKRRLELSQVVKRQDEYLSRRQALKLEMALQV